MRTTSSISFFCRESKVNRNGYAPLECSVTLSGQRKFLNLPMKFKPSEFNKKRPNQEIVEALDLWRGRINSYMVDMMKMGMVITSESLRQVIQQGGVRAYTVGLLFDDYLTILRKRVGIDLKDTVYRKYELVAERALKFLNRDADVSTITPHMIKTIEVSWRAQFDPSTLVGYLTRLKTFVNYGRDNGLITINPFQGIRITKPVKPIKALTEDEVMDLLGKSFKGTLQRVLDLFLIQCGTGLSYSDLMDFSAEDLRQEGNFYYISKQRNKTGRVFTAIVLPFAVPIIKHYGVMVRISNQKFNKRLKELGPYTTHMGRRTYASILAARGCDMNVVSAALGDNLSTASKYYIKRYESQLVKQQIDAISKGL